MHTGRLILAVGRTDPAKDAVSPLTAHSVGRHDICP